MMFKNLLKITMCTTLILLVGQNGYSQTRGTVDGGGANGINLKLMESYKVQEEILLQSRFITPLMKFLAKTQKSDNKYNLSAYNYAIGNILKKKLWYLAPAGGGLEKLGSQIHGIPFVTDQFAIQTASEVFIDKNLYNQMTGELFIEREKMIMHELFMGLKILMRQDSYAQCLFTSNNPDYLQSTDNCFDNEGNKKRSAEGLNLTDKDHSDVRYLTDLVIQNVDNFDKEEKFQDLLLKFVNAFYQRGFISEKLHPYKSGSEEVSIKTIASLIKSKEILKENILYCGHSQWNNYSESKLKELQEKWESLPTGVTWSFKAKYKVRISAEEKNNKVFIKIKDLNGKTLKETVHLRDDKVRGFRLNKEYDSNVLSRDNNFSEYYIKESSVPNKPGAVSEGVVLQVNIDTGAIQQYNAYVNVNYRINPNIKSARRFFNIECSDKETISYKKQ